MKNCLKEYVEGNIPLDKEKFKNPPAKLYPVYSWLWTGNITKKQIQSDIDLMKEAGIKSFYILPLPQDFSPRKMATTLSPEYLSDEFFELVCFAISCAKQNGMSVWLYDEGGWPSGNACEKVIKKVPDCVSKKIEKTENGYELRARKYPYANTPEFHYADSASEKANDVFIDLTYKAYKQKTKEDFGTFLPLIFTDEPVIRYPALPDGARELYSSRYGEDIEDAFPAVFGEEKNDRLRIQYCTVCAEIFRKNYFEKIHNYCRQNGIYFSGHMNMDNTLQGSYMNHYGSQIETLRCFDIPGIDVIWRQIYPFVGGRTYTAEFDNVTGYPFFPRLAPSAANQNGTNLSVSESFAIYGHGITADVIRYVSNYQFVRGINIINLMTIPFEKTGNIPFTMAPLFYPQRPDYKHLTVINDYLARMSYLTTAGSRDADTALVMPLEDVYAGGEREKLALESFSKVGSMLEQNFVDFDIIDENSIKQATVKDGMLCIGNARYKSVIIPENVYLDPVPRQKLSAVSSDILPVLTADSKDIRVMRRKLPSGRALYFVFNEKNSAVTTTLAIDNLKTPCCFDCENGRVYKINLENITLESGQMLVITEDEYFATEKVQYNRQIVISEFEKTPIEKLVLSANGVDTISENLEITEDFSGKVLYTCEVNLEKIPTLSALEFENLCYSADVKINGEYIGAVSLAPYFIEIPEGIFRIGKNKIEITVSNTPANAYAAFEYEKVFEERFLGAYNSKQRLFEKEGLKLPSFENAILKIKDY